jgi:D-xylose transport system permease protein
MSDRAPREPDGVRGAGGATMAWVTRRPVAWRQSVDGERLIGGLTKALEIDARLLTMLGVLLAISAVFGVVTNGIFLSPRNLFNLAVQTSVVGVMAAGMVVVIVARQIDLSVGSLLGFLGIFAAVLQTKVFPEGVWYNWIASLLLCMAMGAVVGAFQGYWVAYRGLPSFIVTLAGLLGWRAVAWLVAGGVNIAPMDENFQRLGGGLEGSIGPEASWIVGLVAVAALWTLSFKARARRRRFGFPVRSLTIQIALVAIGSAAIVAGVCTMNNYSHPIRHTPMGIPIPVLLLIAAVIAMTVIANHTKFGRYIYGIGGNPEAAELSGLNIKLVTVCIFMTMGLLTALAACISIARLNTAPTSLGQLQELNVIAAAVIGGASLRGGIGTVPGAILGALIMQSLINGMVLIGIDTPVQQIVLACGILAAVWFDVVYQKRYRH